MKIIDFFKQNKIDLKNKKIVLAVSGGPDSMALLDMMLQLSSKYHVQLIAAHFDHQLRFGSKKETVVIARYCKQHHVIFENGFWPKKEQPTKGIEAAARHYRYRFLIKVVKKYSADYLLTAHHNDDLLENILLKFIRSGNPNEMNSLLGVSKMANVTLLRPLLSFSKKELLNYDLKHHLAFVEDETNLADETMRNRLRHYVVPLLKKENPLLGKNALRFSEQMTLLSGLGHAYFKQIKQPSLFLNVSYRLPVSALKKLSPAQKKYFWQEFIWQKFQRRVNQDLAGYCLKEYQGYFYLWPNYLRKTNKIFPVKLEQPFSFQKEYFLLSRHLIKRQTCLGSFWASDDQFLAGSFLPGQKLKLKNGQHVKAKKMFAQAKIPNFLRSFCLTIYNKNNEAIWLQNTYQDQSWLTNGQKYYVYLLEKVKN